MEGRIKDLMSENVITISPDTPFTQACRLFANMNVHHLPVKDNEDKLVGIFSATDAIFAMNNELFKYNITSEDDINRVVKIEEVMTCDNLYTLDLNDGLESAMDLLQTKNINSIPILDNGRLVGILTSKDMLDAFRSSIV